MKNEVEIKRIRLDADSAADMLDKVGHVVNPVLKAIVDTRFRFAEKEEGEMSLEFLQGFFSGLFFGQNWMIHLPVGDRAVGFMTQLTLEAARKYLEQIEKCVANGQGTGGVETGLVRAQTELNEEQIILITEVLTLFHSEVISSAPELGIDCSMEIQESLQVTLRSLLRLSLKSPEFRKSLNKHFSAHPLREVREEGWEWLSEILVWES
ncbi:MAG: hypothetical protein ACYCZZ_00620 [Minisyncoccota bacterium]